MAFEIRYPKITGKTNGEQLAQVKSYLFQLVGQLQTALNNLDTAPAYAVSQQPASTKKEEVVVDEQATFNAIKSLIIKSADIVDAYYEEINKRLASEYVAQSDFGEFVEYNEQNISQTATDIEQFFNNLQQIITDIENINFTLAEVNAHIKSGLLYYDDDGLPVYGLEIGQRTTVDGEEIFNKYARFVSDRLSFYDQNDREVAYISDYKLYIRNVEITSSYKIGGFVDTVLSNNDVVTRWVGGDG